MGRGSSPRLRGALPRWSRRRRRVRLIPASAGSTVGPIPAGGLRWAHPRVCGEHTTPHPCIGPMSGSSPRLRGAPPMSRESIRTLRLIPASAGSTAPRTFPTMRTQAHPRVCGEHGPCTARGMSDAGSSPRLRGARDLRPSLRVPVRLIPASAGSTTPPHTPGRCRGAHPRVCGEHCSCSRCGHESSGSSPRLRGALTHPPGVHHRQGLIPASAGSTAAWVHIQGQDQAHPRVCGEHPSSLVKSTESFGSSPRLRGAR